eukprot:15095364-Alexandrium_andersonii.AAC.1
MSGHPAREYRCARGHAPPPGRLTTAAADPQPQGGRGAPPDEAPRGIEPASGGQEQVGSAERP